MLNRGREEETPDSIAQQPILPPTDTNKIITKEEPATTKPVISKIPYKPLNIDNFGKTLEESRQKINKIIDKINKK